MAINDGNRPIVDDSTIFGLDADIRTGREHTEKAKMDQTKKGHQENLKNKSEEEHNTAEKIKNESLDAQKISQTESRR